MNKNVKVPLLVLATLITGMLIGITPLVSLKPQQEAKEMSI